MHTSCRHHQDMENLMRTTPDIKPTRPDRFRKPRCIEKGPKDKQNPLEEIVWYANLLVHLSKSEELDSVDQ